MTLRMFSTMAAICATLYLMMGSASAQYHAQQFRYPRVAAMAHPGPPFTPQYVAPLSHRPWVRSVPRLVAATSFIVSFAPPPASYIGTGLPMGIRATHVLLNGSHTPGRPLKTLTWVASPWLRFGRP